MIENNLLLQTFEQPGVTNPKKKKKTQGLFKQKQPRIFNLHAPGTPNKTRVNQQD